MSTEELIFHLVLFVSFTSFFVTTERFLAWILDAKK